MIKKVLVAIDGSVYSDKALDFALDMAEKFAAKVTILHVSESPVMGAVPQDLTSYSTGDPSVFAKDLQKIHEEILSKAVARAQQAKPELVVSTLEKEGEPALEIVRVAREGGFDVVVVGHKGVSRVQEFFLGNVSEKVSHQAPCSVIIVR
jgi:nucleotide-binding universal stress UspA family protein